jgi:hypothetical protein
MYQINYSIRDQKIASTRFEFKEDREIIFDLQPVEFKQIFEGSGYSKKEIIDKLFGLLDDDKTIYGGDNPLEIHIDHEGYLFGDIGDRSYLF